MSIFIYTASIKKLLIISPSFPPVNAADMHRVRQSVNYFKEFGYEPTVAAVKPQFNEHPKDELLLKTTPKNLKLIWVNAFSTCWTRKIGLGSLALRSLWFYFLAVNKLLKNEKIDLIYFSTTMFPVLILGAYWKKRFNVPYVIDMQDPWHSDYYQNKPKHERPAKHAFSYRLNKFLEPIAMKQVSAIISVSQGYCEMLQSRYPNIKPEMCTVIPFGAFEKDFEIETGLQVSKNEGINFVYLGRGGADMHKSLSIIFAGFKLGLQHDFNLFSKVKMKFIGTSYAKNGTGKPSILPLATEMELEKYVVEQTDRIPYFEAISQLQNADILLIPGSDDPNYTASKVYPCILAKRPILAVFSENSSVINVLKDTNSGDYVSFSSNSQNDKLAQDFYEKMKAILEKLPFVPETNWKAFEPYTAKIMTEKQCEVFDKTLSLRYDRGRK